MTDRKKTIYLIYEFLSEQGGLEREIITHSRFLKEEGYNVKVLTCYYDPKIQELLPFEDTHIESISKIKTGVEWIDLALCFVGLNKLNNYNPDAFLSYSAPMNYLIRKKKTKKINYINHFPHYLYLKGKEKIEWAASTQGMKRWVTVVMSWFLGRWLRKIDRKLIHSNDLRFINSEFTKKRLDKLYSMNSIVSYPPLDPKFKPSTKKMKEQFVFSSSRIIPDKKYEWLVEALGHSRTKLPLYVAGTVEEGYKKILVEAARKHKVHIRFLGRLNTEQIIDYYTNASVFAFPTPEEDFGLVPAESMACGTPVVVWGDGAGPTEQVINGVTGFHAQPYDRKDFGRKIDQVIEMKLKEKNKKKILKNARRFSAEEVKKDFLKEVKKIT